MKGSGPLYAALAGGGILAIIAILLAVGGDEPDLAGTGADIAPPPASPASPPPASPAPPPPSVRATELPKEPPKDTGPDQPARAAQAPPKAEPRLQSAQQQPAPARTPAPQIVVRALPRPEDTDAAAPPIPDTASPERIPRFDVVRVSPGGDMVIAGRAEPNAEVQILDKGETIGAAKADDRGEWVFLPSEQLAPGNRELTLSTQGADGDQHESDRSVLIIMPEVAEVAEAAEATETVAGAVPMIVSTPRTKRASPEIQILQAPEIDHESPITVDVVEYDSEGQIGVAGRAEPETAVRIYVNDQPAGESAADDTGQWRIEPPRDLQPGLYRLRADQLAPGGEVVARVELPFVKEDLAALPEPEQTYVVQPGNSLWRIARARYGSGLQYVVIYQSNRSQIRDPDLIYPGQVFDIPR